MKLFVFLVALSCSNAAPQDSTTEGWFEPGTSTPGSRFDTTTPGSRFDTTTPGSRFDTTTAGSRFDTTTPGSRFDTTTPGSRFDSTTEGGFGAETTTPGSRSDLGLPSFKVLGSSRSGIPEIKVGLQGGLNHEMVLEPYSRSPCNFIGHLKNVPDSSVAVTGCLEKPGDKMHITMIAPIEAKSSIFELDFNGQVTALENPQKHQTEPSYKFQLKNREDIKVVMPNECDDQGFKVDKDGDEEEDLFEELEAEMALKSGVSSRTWPEAIYVYVKFGYDRTLKNQLENSDGTDFATWTDAIMTHVQGHYRHPTLPTKIEFKWDNSEAIYKNRDLPSTDSLDTWAGMMETEDADPKVDLYAVFGYDQWDFQPCTASSANYRGNGQCVSTKGVGFVGTACKDYSKISFNEYSKTTAETAMTLAHEMGHNFGMSHDFDAKHGGDNSPCNHQGIMSYGDKLNQWSTCSVNDFTGYYNSMKWGSTCMKDFDPKSNCFDVCPGGACTLSSPDFCSNPSGFGGCNGRYKDYFDKFCKKSCGICGDGATKPATTGSGTSSACSNVCPGSECNITPDTICDNPASFGGCDGQYSSIFGKYCKKACNQC